MEFDPEGRTVGPSWTVRWRKEPTKLAGQGGDDPHAGQSPEFAHSVAFRSVIFGCLGRFHRLCPVPER